MTTVMLGGSRKISRLTLEVVDRLDRILEQRFAIVVGDANGADKALQKHLSVRAYKAVTVFCSGESPRNNVGGWPCRQVITKARPGTFEFYSAKDQAMAAIATVGFMLWDGSSAGTMLNVWRLQNLRKSSLVYLTSDKQFSEVRRVDDWERVIRRGSVEARADIAKRISVEETQRDDRRTAELTLFPDLHSIGMS